MTHEEFLRLVAQFTDEGSLSEQAFLEATAKPRQEKLERLLAFARKSAVKYGLTYALDEASLSIPARCPFLRSILDVFEDSYHSVYAPSLIRIYGASSHYFMCNIAIVSGAFRRLKPDKRRAYFSPEKLEEAKTALCDAYDLGKPSSISTTGDSWEHLYHYLRVKIPEHPTLEAYLKDSANERHTRSIILARMADMRGQARPIDIQIPAKCPITNGIINITAQAPKHTAAKYLYHEFGPPIIVSRLGAKMFAKMSKSEQQALIERIK